MADKFKILIVVVLLVVTKVITASAFDETTKLVTINRNGESTKYETSEDTLEGFLTTEGFEVNEHLILEEPLNTVLQAKNSFNVVYEIPITLNIDGKSEVQYFKEGITIDEIINGLDKASNVEYVYELDDRDKKLYKAHVVTLKTKRTEVFSKVVKVPYETRRVSAADLYLGEQKVVQKGKDGTTESYTEVVFYGNEEIQHKELPSKVIEEPVDEIIHVGTKQRPSTNSGGSSSSYTSSNTSSSSSNNSASESSKDDDSDDSDDSNENSGGGKVAPNGKTYSRVITMNSSAYTAGYESTGKKPGDKGYGITASGMKARKGVVAVDPRVIPLGTRLYIPGYGEAIAADKGSAIKGNKIDLFYASKSAALKHGRRTVKVYVLD